MNKRVKQVLVASAVAAGGAMAASAAAYAVTDKLMKLAMERDVTIDLSRMEKAKKQIHGSKKLAEFSDALEAGAQMLRDRDTETVAIEADDGTRLVGHWYPCDNAKRVLVAMHGWRSSWAKDFGLVADAWHDSGCSVLFAEQRGQGESGGEYMGFGMTERHDCLRWVQWVNEVKGDTLPIYLMGVSMGATTVMMASDLDMPVNVRGIIADCGFTSPYAIWKHVAENNLHVAYDLVSKIADDMCKKRIRMGSRDFSAAQALEKTTIPVLFIHGTDDRFVPVEMTYENYKACASEKRLLIVPGAEHGMSYFTERVRYEEAVIAFWNDFDQFDS